MDACNAFNNLNHASTRLLRFGLAHMNRKLRMNRNGTKTVNHAAFKQVHT